MGLLRALALPRILPLLGPAFLVFAAQLCPIEDGRGGRRAQISFDSVWVLLLASSISSILQYLSGRLGIVTGRSLAQVMHDEYPRWLTPVLLTLSEISLAAFDLTLVLGMAIGLHHLVGLPLSTGLFLSLFDAVLLQLILPYLDGRQMEVAVLGAIGTVLLLFWMQISFSKPALQAVAKGLWHPSLQPNSLPGTMALFGTSTIPHNMYLYSMGVEAVLQAQTQSKGGKGSPAAVSGPLLREILPTVGLASVINLAVVLVAATSTDLGGLAHLVTQDASILVIVEQAFRSKVVLATSGLVLMVAGFLMTLSVTRAGQVSLEGFTSVRAQPWLRRILTRVIGVVPAVLYLWTASDAGAHSLLMFLQILLALQLPFSMVPLVRITSSKVHMGEYSNSPLAEVTAWGLGIAVLALDLWLVADFFAALGVEADEWAGMGLWEWLASGEFLSYNSELGIGLTPGAVWRDLVQLGAALAAAVVIGGGLMLLIWMMVAPLQREQATAELRWSLEGTEQKLLQESGRSGVMPLLSSLAAPDLSSTSGQVTCTPLIPDVGSRASKPVAYDEAGALWKDAPGIAPPASQGLLPRVLSASGLETARSGSMWDAPAKEAERYGVAADEGAGPESDMGQSVTPGGDVVRAPPAASLQLAAGWEDSRAWEIEPFGSPAFQQTSAYDTGEEEGMLTKEQFAAVSSLDPQPVQDEEVVRPAEPNEEEEVEVGASQQDGLQEAALGLEPKQGPEAMAIVAAEELGVEGGEADGAGEQSSSLVAPVVGAVFAAGRSPQQTPSLVIDSENGRLGKRARKSDGPTLFEPPSPPPPQPEPQQLLDVGVAGDSTAHGEPGREAVTQVQAEDPPAAGQPALLAAQLVSLPSSTVPAPEPAPLEAAETSPVGEPRQAIAVGSLPASSEQEEQGVPLAKHGTDGATAAPPPQLERSSLEGATGGAASPTAGGAESTSEPPPDDAALGPVAAAVSQGDGEQEGVNKEEEPSTLPPEAIADLGQVAMAPLAAKAELIAQATLSSGVAGSAPLAAQPPSAPIWGDPSGTPPATPPKNVEPARQQVGPTRFPDGSISLNPSLAAYATSREPSPEARSPQVEPRSAADAASAAEIEKAQQIAIIDGLLDKADEDMDADLIDAWDGTPRSTLPGGSVGHGVGAASPAGSFKLYDGPSSNRSWKSIDSEGGGSMNGSLSKLSGLGRGARRQFAMILDDFWGHIFDLHGQPVGADPPHKGGKGPGGGGGGGGDLDHQQKRLRSHFRPDWMYDEALGDAAGRPSHAAMPYSSLSHVPRPEGAYAHRGGDVEGNSHSTPNLYAELAYENASAHLRPEYDAASSSATAGLRTMRRGSSFQQRHSGSELSPPTTRRGSLDIAAAAPSFGSRYSGPPSYNGLQAPIAELQEASSYDSPMRLNPEYPGYVEVAIEARARLQVQRLVEPYNPLERGGAGGSSGSFGSTDLGRKAPSRHPWETGTNSSASGGGRGGGAGGGSYSHHGPVDLGSYGPASRDAGSYDVASRGHDTEFYGATYDRAPEASPQGGFGHQAQHPLPPASQAGPRRSFETFGPSPPKLYDAPMDSLSLLGGRGGGPRSPPQLLPFDELAPLQRLPEGFSLQSPPAPREALSFMSRSPHDMLFGVGNSGGGGRAAESSATVPGHGRAPPGGGSGGAAVDSQEKTMREHLESMRYCMHKLLRIEGSDWLFRFDTGADEDLIAAVAAREKEFSVETASMPPSSGRSGQNQPGGSRGPGGGRQGSSAGGRREQEMSGETLPPIWGCQDHCIWEHASLISFGVWCVHRILELSQMESRPELWGKYTYVLNRLQGTLDPAFSKQRTVQLLCACFGDKVGREPGAYRPPQAIFAHPALNGLSYGASHAHVWSWSPASFSKTACSPASLFLDMIKEVEAAVGARKGRTGTAAGDVAFPKGKENLASVLKRYKRRLASKPGSGAAGGGGSSGSAARKQGGHY